MDLLDTNAISELRKAGAGRAGPNVARWATSAPASRLFISVISLMALESGVRLMARLDAHQGALRRTWLRSHVVPTFAGRMLGFLCLVLALVGAYRLPTGPRIWASCLQMRQKQKSPGL